MQKKRLIDANAFDFDLETMEKTLLGAPQIGKDRASVVQMVRKTLAAAPTIGKEQNLMFWRKTEEEPPTEKDASKYGEVIVWYAASDHASAVHWFYPTKYPKSYPYWMPLPKEPEQEK